MSKVKLPTLRRLVNKWQPILALNDYSITIATAEIKGQVLAICSANSESHRAMITVNERHDEIASVEMDGSLGVTSLEETVVHEMLHIVMIQLKDAALELCENRREANVLRTIEERTVDRLSIALVRKFNDR